LYTVDSLDSFRSQLKDHTFTTFLAACWLTSPSLPYLLLIFHWRNLSTVQTAGLCTVFSGLAFLALTVRTDNELARFILYQHTDRHIHC